jgi:hypothetical protein
MESHMIVTHRPSRKRISAKEGECSANFLLGMEMLQSLTIETGVDTPEGQIKTIAHVRPEI